MRNRDVTASRIDDAVRASRVRRDRPISQPLQRVLDDATARRVSQARAALQLKAARGAATLPPAR